jgi:hypothetical protein
MPSIGGINTGGILIPSSTISSYNNSYGNTNTQNNNDLNLYRVTVLYDDHSISVETLSPTNYSKSELGSGSNNRYYPYDANISRFPKIGEIVELKLMPTPKEFSNSNKSSRRVFGYVRAVNVWNNLNTNKILDPSVPGNNSNEKTVNINTKNYQNSLNGFV